MKSGSSRSFWKLAVQNIFYPCKIFLNKRLYMFLPFFEALPRRQFFQAFIQLIDCRDPYQCLICGGPFCQLRILYGFDRIREIPSCMGPAVGVRQSLKMVFEQMVLCQAVGYQNALEAFQPACPYSIRPNCAPTYNWWNRHCARHL